MIPKRRIPAPSLTLILLIAGLHFLTGFASAQKNIYQHTYPKSGASKISLTSPFEKGPNYGFHPIQVAIKNGTSKDRSWRLQFKSDGERNYSSNFKITVKAGQEIKQDILVPIHWLPQYSRYRQESIHIQADGFSNLSTSNYEQLPEQWPSIIISEKLAARNLTLLSNYLKDQRKKGSKSSSSSNLSFASSCDNQLLPSDWRAYLGYDAMMIAADEWTQLRPAVQKAILERNRFGGTLQIYTEPRDKQLDYRSLGFDRKPVLGNIIRSEHSYGVIELHGWDGRNVKLAQAYNTLRNSAENRLNFEQAYSKDWKLQKDFGRKRSNPVLVMLILTVFSVLVGPVNFFVFAKAGRRHRLFFTTPLISFIAGLLVLAFILFEDGIGGQGRRMLVIDLESAATEKRAYITQEQISRTGVLLGNRFQLQDSSFISPVALAHSRWSPRINYSNHANYALENDLLSGDWFQSRREQAQFIQSVQPTRSRIEMITEVTPTQDPKLFSSLEFTVEEFYYVGEGGRVWKAQTDKPIPPGSEIILAASSRSELNTWWNEHSATLSVGRPNNKTADHSLRRQTRAISFRPGHFFTVSKDPKLAFIETLDSIRWTNADALIFGPVTKRPSAPASTKHSSAAKQ